MGATKCRYEPVRENHRSDTWEYCIFPVLYVAVLVETPVLVTIVAWDQGVSWAVSATSYTPSSTQGNFEGHISGWGQVGQWA